MSERDFLDGVLAGFYESGEGFNGEYVGARFGDRDDGWMAQFLCQSYICGGLYDWRACVDWQVDVVAETEAARP